MNRSNQQRSLRELTSDERGVSLVFTAVALVTLLGGAAIAIDLGMAYTARTEAQRAADASALAGAGWLAVHPSSGDGTLAREEALRFAMEHDVINEGVDADEVDINVDTDEDTVGVTVYRDQGHGNPLGTFFAKILGFETVDVAAHAVAKAAPTIPKIPCTLPLTLPDRWHELDPEREPESTDTFDADEDYYNTEDTGYNAEEHYGEQVTLKTNTAPGNYNPSWWGPYRRSNTQGAADYRAQIKGCTEESEEPQTLGDEVNSEPGNMTGPTKQGFDDLYDQDPDVYWKDSGENVPNGGCVWDPNQDGGACTTNSPRIRPAPLFDPRDAPDPGAADYFEIVNFGNFFVEEMTGGQVTVRFMGVIAQHGGDPGGTGNKDDLFKAVRLIE